MGIIQSFKCCFGRKDMAKEVVQKKVDKVKEIVDDTGEILEDIIDFRSNVVELIDDIVDHDYNGIVGNLYDFKDIAYELVVDSKEFVCDIDDLF